MVQIWMFSDEWLARYTPLEKLKHKTALNSTNATRGSTDEWTYEWTNIQMDKWKDENYIPLGINARGINSSSHIMRKPVLWFMGTTKAQIRLSRDAAQFFSYFTECNQIYKNKPTLFAVSRSIFLAISVKSLRPSRFPSSAAQNRAAMTKFSALSCKQTKYYF